MQQWIVCTNLSSIKYHNNTDKKKERKSPRSQEVQRHMLIFHILMMFDIRADLSVNLHFYPLDVRTNTGIMQILNFHLAIVLFEQGGVQKTNLHPIIHKQRSVLINIFTRGYLTVEEVRLRKTSNINLLRSWNDYKYMRLWKSKQHITFI